MNKLQGLYFTWLGERVDPESRRIMLNRELYKIEFRWTIAIDENRKVDGYYLREEFLQTYSEQPTTHADIAAFQAPNISVFEVLVALASRMDFELSDLSDVSKHHIWYVELLDNLDLALDFTDKLWRWNSDIKVNAIIKTLLDRTYDRNGLGGLFPVKNAVEDMRTVEIWYQMMVYLNPR